MDAVAADAPDALARATATLDAGELVLVPGDLRYLLVADALDDAALERLFHATGRGADEPPTVIIAGLEDLHHVAYGSATARDAAVTHWPGPTTLLLKPRPWLPEAVTAGRDEVRVSVPAREFLRALAKQFGPLAACAHDAATGAQLRVDAGPLAGGEAKVIPLGTAARP